MQIAGSAVVLLLHRLVLLTAQQLAHQSASGAAASLAVGRLCRRAALQPAGSCARTIVPAASCQQGGHHVVASPWFYAPRRAVQRQHDRGGHATVGAAVISCDASETRTMTMATCSSPLADEHGVPNPAW